MKITEFKKGQTAYVLDMKKGYNSAPTIKETIVEAIGRKYVTTNYGNKYEEGYDANPYGLNEVRDTGKRTLLCPDREHALSCIEQYELELWMHQALHYMSPGTYSLEQLRKVKDILSTGLQGRMAYDVQGAMENEDCLGNIPKEEP